MIGKRLVALACGLLLGAGIAVAVPSMASAVQPYEWDTAVVGSAPSSYPAGLCNGITGGWACFERTGDKLWVDDWSGDGWSVTASWVNYLMNEAGHWVAYRQGSCVNKLGTGHWGVCNKDFYEDGTSPNALGGAGSYLTVYACLYHSTTGEWGGCTGGYVDDWYNNA
jgi:hypothetical protein